MESFKNQILVNVIESGPKDDLNNLENVFGGLVKEGGPLSSLFNLMNKKYDLSFPVVYKKPKEFPGSDGSVLGQFWVQTGELFLQEDYSAYDKQGISLEGLGGCETKEGLVLHETIHALTKKRLEEERSAETQLYRDLERIYQAAVSQEPESNRIYQLKDLSEFVVGLLDNEKFIISLSSKKKLDDVSYKNKLKEELEEIKKILSSDIGSDTLYTQAVDVVSHFFEGRTKVHPNHIELNNKIIQYQRLLKDLELEIPSETVYRIYENEYLNTIEKLTSSGTLKDAIKTAEDWNIYVKDVAGLGNLRSSFTIDVFTLSRRLTKETFKGYLSVEKFQPNPPLEYFHLLAKQYKEEISSRKNLLNEWEKGYQEKIE